MVGEKISKFTFEFRKTLKTALVAAFGLVIALSWNEVIKEMVASLTSLSPIQGKLISALVITFVSVLAIIAITHFIRTE